MDDLTDPSLGEDPSTSSDSSPPQDQSPSDSQTPVDSSPPSPPTENTPPDESPPDSTAPSNDSPAPVTPSPNGSLPLPIFSPPSPISSEAPRSEKEHSHSKSKSSSKDSKHSSESDSKKSDSGSSDSSSSSLDAGVIAGLAAAAVLLLAVIILCICCKRRKNKKKQIYYMDPQHPYKGENMYYNNGPPSQWHGGPNMDHVVKLSQQPPSGAMMPGNGGWGAPPPPPNNASPQMGGFNQSQFSYEMLAAATNGFSQENLLGQGGFGYVHKGVLPSGKIVAIKSLKSGSGQGEREFQAEVEIISRVHHRYLVSLVGYCISERQRMLVYEYVSNKTLEFHLHGKGQPVMDWATRLKIALGSAKGLAYLHEDCHPRIIHRDIKAANILLDDTFEAMVADFGLAKLSTDNNTHVSTRVMGTFGYLAPEYASSGKLTEKSDVFSFGVMLLELITGHQPVDLTGEMEDSLVEWARPLLASAIQDGIYDELVDKRLERNYHPDEMARMVTCAAASVRHSARRRPKMSQIVRALEGNSSLEDLNETGKALQSGVSSMSTSSMSGMTSSGDSHMYDTCAYNADIMKFRKMVLSEDSSEFGTTGEFGTNRSSTSS